MDPGNKSREFPYFSCLKPGFIQQSNTMRGYRFRAFARSALLFLGVVCAFSSFAKPVEPKDYAEQMWQVSDGLPSAQIKAILQSQDGFLWLGTPEGLARFDGVSFVTMERKMPREMRGQVFIGLAEGNEGSVWFSNGHGLSRHKNGGTTYYTTRNGLPSDYVLCLLTDHGGTLWVGTDKGLCRLERDTFVVVEDGIPLTAVRTLVEDRSGNLWVGTYFGVFRYREGHVTPFTKQNNLLIDNPVMALAEGKGGRMWVGTISGLTVIEGGQARHFQTQDGLLNNNVRSLLCDDTGTLWVGTHAGLQRLINEQGPLLTYHSPSTADPGTGVAEFVYSIVQDHERNMWVGSSLGLRRLKATRFSTYSTTEGMPHRIVSSVIEDKDGTMWVGGINGISRIQGNDVIAGWGTRNGRLTRANILSLLEDKHGEIWIGTDNGVYRIVEQTNLLHYLSPKDGVPEPVVRTIFQSSDGTYWCGHNNAVSVFREGHFSNFDAGIAFSNVKTITEDKEHRIWIGSEEGVTMCAGANTRRYTMQDGLSSDLVNVLHFDKQGTLWIGTDNGGLNRFKDGRFFSITPASGLFGERIFSLLEDDTENFWMGSRSGIYRVSKFELDQLADGKIRTIHCIPYGRTDGIRNTQCSSISHPAAWKSRDGRLWFATLDGVVVTDPKKVKINSVPPRIVINRVVADGKSISPADGTKFPPGHGNFEFHYTGICLQAPEKIRFKYMLKGRDQDWIDAGEIRIANYNSVPPGDYEFLLRACNNDGVWSETPLSLAFTLQPRFYQTYPFYGGCVVGLILAIVGMHNFRVRAMRKREHELALLVQKRTEHLQETLRAMETFTYSLAHDLRAPLRAIRGLTQALFEDYRPQFDSAALDYCKRIEHSVERMDQLISDMLIYGQLAHSEVPLSAVDLESVVERVFTELEPQIATRKAVVEIRRPLPKVTANFTLLSQVLMNLVSNSIKFVPAAKIPDIRIWAERYYGNVKIFVQDNGIGIKPEYHERIFLLFERLHTGYAGTGVGLAIVRKGMERMGGKVGVESQPGKGATFWLELPKAQEAAEPAANAVSRKVPVVEPAPQAGANS
jgi:ligand-binding sensor domain-containing protein/signal transduction histidine kinase